MKMRTRVVMALLAGLLIALPGCAKVETEVKTEAQTESQTEASAQKSEDVQIGKYLVDWGVQVGSTGEDLCVDIDSDGNGYTVMAGSTQGKIATELNGHSDLFAQAYDASGKLLWQIQNGTDKKDEAKSVALDSKNNAYILGMTGGDGSMTLPLQAAVKGRIILEKVDPSGKVLWIKQLGLDNNQDGEAIFIDDNDQIYIAGSTTALVGKAGLGAKDGYVYKLDSEGEILAGYQFGTEDQDLTRDMVVDGKGNIYIVGETTGAVDNQKLGGKDLLVTKLDRAGDLVFNRLLGTDRDDYAYAICVDEKANIFIGGSTMGKLADTLLGEGDSYVLGLNDKGQQVWAHQFGTTKWDGVHHVEMAKNDPGVVIAAGCQRWPECQSFIRQYKTDGTAVSVNELDPGFATCGRKFAQDAKGNIYHIGGTHSGLYGDYMDSGTASDIYMVKTHQ